MKYTLVHRFPDGEERSVPTAFESVSAAASFAGRWLVDNERAAEGAAHSFARFLAETEVGRSLTHEASGYAARIELAEKVTLPDPAGPLRVTKPRRLKYEAWAEVWEVRTHGPASLRTLYHRWTEDGEHLVKHDPIMLKSGSFYIGGEFRRHKAGDLYATTIQGRGAATLTLLPQRQLPQDAPTDRLLLP
ncbi:hypothetical protein [Streptomyces sp. NPDC001165]|uniref:hypothetical protein n=1 Tax=Streptomyces sp. NPDC001165 TaxID=3364546 RepID=UPI0036BED243